eukprot:jgi/Tetstr1/433883/TSEL_023063.t1
MLARGPRGGTSRGVRAAGATSLSPPPLLRLLLLPALLHLAAAAAAAGQGGAAARRAGLASRRPSAAAARRMRTAPCATYASQGLKVAKDTVSFRELLINRESCGGGECPRLSEVSLAGVPLEALPRNPLEGLGRQRSWRTCALVGNSGSLLAARHGAAIDAADVVLRFNEAPTLGLEAHVGNRTTHRMLNHVWARGYADSKAVRPGFRLRQGYHPLEPNVTLLVNACVPARYCSLPRDFAQLHARMAAVRPDVQVAYTSKRVVGAANRLLSIYGSCVYAGARQRAPAPTTGLAAMVLLLKLCQSVTLYGMGERQPGAAYHYYDQGHGTTIRQGFRAHDFQLERSLLRDLTSRGYLRVCGVASCSGAA